MAQSCPTCMYQNPDGSSFCIRCGSKLETTSMLANSALSPSTFPKVDPSGGIAYSSSSTPSLQLPDIQRSAMFSSAPMQMGTTSGPMSSQLARHAFAGYGTLVAHHSWLLNDEHTQATALRSAIAEILGQRSILSLKLNSEKLQERGFWTEEREYLRLQRGATTTFVYVAPAGRDLYISRATTIQPPIEPVRVALLIFVLVEIFFGPGFIQGVMANMIASSASGILGGYQLLIPFIIVTAIFGLLYVPSIISLLIYLFASFRHWLAEKDFWVYLRRNSLNDFEIDDIMLIEHATDETVLAAVKQLNLDASKIVPPAMGYQTKRRIRVI